MRNNEGWWKQNRQVHQDKMNSFDDSKSHPYLPPLLAGEVESAANRRGSINRENRLK